MLSALLCAVNRPECSDVAFVDDEKYISCEVEVGGEETGCEGYSAQTALSLGGDVEWCIHLQRLRWWYHVLLYQCHLLHLL